jgi:plasmid stabilization system protein ParE
MARIIWTDDAIADFEAIVRYLAHDAPDYAEFFKDELFRKIYLLQDFPERGHFVPESLDSDDKEIHCENYRVIYHLEMSETDEYLISLVAIIHGSRIYKPR